MSHLAGYNYIQAKQVQWAKNRGLSLVGSKGERGAPVYTAALADNLFHPLLPEVETAFLAADGNELAGQPAKMQALHSSSALAVNVFQYWQSAGKVEQIAAACGLCSSTTQARYDLRFEDKHPILDGVHKPPNIDIVLYNKTPGAAVQRLAVESKFCEPYDTRPSGGLKPAYFAAEHIWRDIPHLHGLAQRISPDDHEFAHLHAGQLIKHILGLKRQCGRGGFRLLYLWYDVLGPQSKCHHDEIAVFTQAAKADGIHFYSLTYQELIARLANRHCAEHRGYIEYLTGRYL